MPVAHFSDGKTETHRSELSLLGVTRLMKRSWGSTASRRAPESDCCKHPSLPQRVELPVHSGLPDVSSLTRSGEAGHPLLHSQGVCVPQVSS